MSKSYEKVLYSLSDGVARISMNDPATRNAGSAQMGEERLRSSILDREIAGAPNASDR